MRKMRGFAKVLVLTLVMVIGGIAGVSAEAKSKNGFTYDENELNVQWKAYSSYTVRSAVGEKLGTMSYVTGLGRYENSNDYILMAKEVMTPNKSKVHINLLKTGYGFSEYVSLSVTLPSLNDYQPQNNPSTNKVDLSIGASKSGPEVGLSYSITHNDLDIISKCSTPDRKYHIVYDYKPSMANPFASNKYVANESVQLGMAEFSSSAKTIKFTVNYDARFGAAQNSSCSPWCIYIDYVRKATATKEYVYTISKKK